MSSAEKPDYHVILPVFNEIVTILHSLDSGKTSGDAADAVTLITSCASFSGALYLMKYSGILRGSVDETEMGAVYRETDDFFQYVGGACLRALENEEGRIIPPDSDEGITIVARLCGMQHKTMMEYLAFIVKTIARGVSPDSSPGTSVLERLTRDMYGHAITNPAAALALMRHILAHIPDTSPGNHHPG